MFDRVCSYLPFDSVCETMFVFITNFCDIFFWMYWCNRLELHINVLLFCPGEDTYDLDKYS